MDVRPGRYHSPMTTTSQPEAWLRGPLDGVPPLLMPVAHALLHAQEDATHALDGLDAHQIWMKAGTASVGFHVRHLMGALDRLLTYARGEGLSAEQRTAARVESEPGDPPPDAGTLVGELDQALARGIAHARATGGGTLTD